MAIVKVMNKDETGTSPANKVTGEELTVTKGTPQKLAHSIFFQDGFYIYEKVNDRANTLLRRGVDFDFTSEDTIATEISNKNCWKEIIVYKDVATVYLDYQVYGDFVTAEFINAVKAQTGNTTERIEEFNRLLDAAKKELETHKAETAPHSATADAIAKSLALRTATGTLKASKATENDELVNLELLNKMEQKANAELTKEFQKADNELAEIIRAGKPAISIDNFELQEEAERGKALNARVNETVAYHNALRNERGSLAVPEAVSDTEAVNKKQLETHVSEKIAELVDGAPGTLDTLKEIADALNGNANIVNTLTQRIDNAKADVQADATNKAIAAQAAAVKHTDDTLKDYYTKAEVDESQRVQNERIKKLEDARPTSGAGALYDFAQAEAVKTAKAEATEYTNSKLENYYTKTDVDESQRVQNERIKKLEAARLTSGAGALYDFAQAEAVKTGETIKLADGTVKDIYRLCVEKKTNNTAFYITKAHPIMSENIITITGMAYSPNINTTLENAFSIVFNDTDGFVLIPKLTDKDFNKVKIIIDFFI